MKNSLFILVVATCTALFSLFTFDTSGGKPLLPNNSLESKMDCLSLENKKLAKQFINTDRYLRNLTAVYNDTKTK